MSNSSIYFSAHSLIAFSSLKLKSPPKYFLRNLFSTCIALKAIFQSIGSSNNNPTPLLSSDTNDIPLFNTSKVLFNGRGSFSKYISPPASKSPIIPFGNPSLPWPARPPIPKISPLRIFNDTFLTASPGISTQRFFASKIISSSLSLYKSLFCSSPLSISLPTIHLAISLISVPSVGLSTTTIPSLRTTIVSQTDVISRSL